MRPVVLKLINDNFGTTDLSVVVYTDKSASDLKIFIKYFSDILTKTDRHGYNNDITNVYEVTKYIKNALEYTDDEMIITEPERIDIYY